MGLLEKNRKAFISFHEEFNHYRGTPLKTKRWTIKSTQNGCKLGQIKWYAAWRKYCFLPEEGTVFDAKCLLEIVSFIDTEMKEHRKQNRLKRQENEEL